MTDPTMATQVDREVVARVYERGDWPTMPSTIRECPLEHLAERPRFALDVAVEARLTAEAQAGARVGALEKALRPLAAAHGTVARLDASDDRWPDDMTLDCMDATGFAEHVTVGDLRAARAALSADGDGR